jgi:hypothetical protein
MIGQILSNNNEKCYSNFSHTFHEVNTPLACSRANLMLFWKPVVTLVYSLGKGESKAMVFSSWKRAHRCHIFLAALVSGGFSAQWWWQLPLELSPGGIHSNTQVGACRLSLLAGTQSSPSSIPRKICSPYGVCVCGCRSIQGAESNAHDAAREQSAPKQAWRPAQVLLVESNQGPWRPVWGRTRLALLQVFVRNSG